MATALYSGAKPGQSAVAKLVFLSGVLGSGWAARTVFSPFQDMVRSNLSLTDVQISLVMGAAMSVPSILLSVVFGRLIDTHGRIRILALLNLITMLGVIGTAFAQTYAGLIAYRALAGLGMLEEVVVLSLAADLFPPGQRGRANIMIVVGDYAGSSLGFVLAGWLMPMARSFAFGGNLEGWRGVQLLFGVAGLLVTLPLLSMREPERRECSAVAGMALRDGCRMLWGLRAVLLPLLAGQIAMITAGNVVWIWALPSLYRTFGLAPAALGDLAAALMSAAALAGALGAGLLADRLDSRGRGALLVAGLSCGVAIPASLFPLSQSLPIAAVLLFLLVLSNTAAALSSNTFGVIAIPNDLRGLWFGLSGVASLLVGYGIAPTMVASVGSLFNGRGALPDALALVLLVSNAIALATYLEALRVTRFAAD